MSVKLPHLLGWTARRQEIAAIYDRRLSSVKSLETPVVAPGREHVYHLYVIRHESRDALAAALARAGVQTAINYPTALPFLPAYSRFGHTAEQFLRAHYNQSRVLSLPMFPEMSSRQIDSVVNGIEGFVG